MEKLEEKESFADPSFYSKIFQDCLEESMREDSDKIQWATVISCYTQTMRTQIGNRFKEEDLEKIDLFIESSLKNPIDTKNNQTFLAEMIPVLNDL